MSDEKQDTQKTDPFIQAAFEEEQKLLDEAVLSAQAQHLMNRVVQLNADVRRANAKKGDSADLSEFEEVVAAAQD